MRATESVSSGLSVLGSIALGTVVGLACASGLPAQTASPAVSGTAPARHSTVHFEGGLLTVSASNASLNGILREIARTTGMKISGAVPEDRVFGTYGPEDPQRVLATLLDGTGTNILILSNEADKPLELVLTRRTGGVTPPNPNGTAEDASDQDSDDAAPVRSASAPPVGPAGAQNINRRGPQSGDAPSPSTQANGNQPSEVTQPVVFAPIGATSAPATATTTPVDPDDPSDPSTETVKTPQQIFEQLQGLQQGNGQAAGSAQPPQ